MEYTSDQAIYLQIAEMIFEKILAKEWQADERIPSVRELASNFQVNPNTIMRTYNYLQQENIIYNQRGIGYFLALDAFAKTQQLKKNHFLNNALPAFIKQAAILGYTLEELTILIKNQSNNENK